MSNLRAKMIRLAASMPKGSKARKDLLSILVEKQATFKEYVERQKAEGKPVNLSEDEWEARFGDKGKGEDKKKDEGKGEKGKDPHGSKVDDVAKAVADYAKEFPQAKRNHKLLGELMEKTKPLLKDVQESKKKLDSYNKEFKADMKRIEDYAEDWASEEEMEAVKSIAAKGVADLTDDDYKALDKFSDNGWGSVSDLRKNEVKEFKEKEERLGKKLDTMQKIMDDGKKYWSKTARLAVPRAHRASLIRLAASMPKGSTERKALLNVLAAEEG